MRRGTKIALWAVATFAGLVAIAVLALLLILPSRWFHDHVRDRIVAEVERATGGETEIGSFDFDWRKLTARIGPLTLHGTEPAGEAPLLHADSVTVGLKLVSVLRRDIDIASLHVERPEINLLIDAQGHTNIPNPRVKTNVTDPVQAILDLAVKDFAVDGGTLRYADRRVPLDVRGQGVEIHLSFDRRGPKYAGTVNSESLTVDAGSMKQFALGLESRIQVERNTLTVESASFTTRRSKATITARLSDFRRPTAEFTLEATGDLAELGGPLGLPSPHTGTITFSGRGTYSEAESFRLAGTAGARGIAVDQGGVRVRNAALDAEVQLNRGELRLTTLRAGALGGRFSGSAALANDFKDLRVQGDVSGLTIRRLAEVEGISNPAWDGTVSGPVELTGTMAKGSRDLKVSGNLQIVPIPGVPPFEGDVDFAYDQRSGRLQLGQSFLKTPASRVNVAGTWGDALHISLETRDLRDVLPVAAMVSPGSKVPELPVAIGPGGRVAFEGTASGPADRIQMSGVLQGEKLTFEKRPVDTFRTSLVASSSRIRLQNTEAAVGDASLTGSLDVGLNDWKVTDASPLDGKFRLRSASVASVLRAADMKDVQVDGALVADAEIKGRAGDPNAAARIVLASPTLFGEKFDRMQADLRHTGPDVERAGVQLEAGAGRVWIDATFTHPANNLREGQAAFEITTRNLSLGHFKRISDLRPGTSGTIEVRAKGVAGLRNSELALHELAGQVSMRDLVADGRELGNFTVDVSSKHDVADYGVKGSLRGSDIRGKGSLNLTGDYHGQGELSFTPMAISVLQDIAMPKRGGEPLPFDGVVAGKLAFSGSLRNPDQTKLRLELSSLELVPARQIKDRDKQRDLALRNQGPVVIERDQKGWQVRSAKFTGTDTNLDLSGTLDLSAKSPWDLKVNGSLNLGVLDEFSPDMLSTGIATVNATMRGSLEHPQLIGRFELKDASFYMTDLPNGLDQANGVIVFDPSRATIEKLTATSGGGRITLSGYIVYGNGDPAFRLQARAEGVRIRYPEGVSTSSNAALNLTGSKSQSVLSGTITVLRASFNPQTDVGSLLAGAGKPIETPTAPNPYLQSMHLDVRIETVPNLSLQTTLSKNLEAQADLRVRGTAVRPAVLGHVNVTQGEIEFFGNKYQINRGEISFYNLARIEPVVAMDLETKVRGVDVNISFNGTLPNKLNFSYRSDPPLQSNEIIALLAMGRDPTRYGGLGSAQAQSSTSAAAGGLNPTGNMIGSALAAPVSDRLQRFFGVSRLKLDPSLSSLTGSQSTQSRLGLTIEQQVSRDITVTYVANLTDANQQIIRVQWDLTRTWSVVALREENGLFGIDFQFRKRFK
jgi:translocation and assembly module TamB